ncbi:tetratricopeptide repeat protein [Shewanella fidelis]|uniref:Tetratricopeptide repeat protein n=1 Tax=Shewanella fidelis TaxID=173509 RepID=A0AAW8NTF9_9GAMM|nr:tetratricopeptide repeat protein [Shewanella fidelis]MDR8525780.1 tetratricopeptide repeat protein [Shewanella fidelis]MDW4812711.1 tetratricopeptide repeat protein [Shewanella fidelis]MDW4816459.1 tetratricopeptide repeat protein [Shewanella fidelis]MDW4820377.1 tetratricopeptide repeat protein [Shewanella fidelis]MDW4825175.1 tetratricopeptide repeat protein [Shewanella fidelis]
MAKPKVSPIPVLVEPCQLADCKKNFQEYKTLSRYGHSDAMYTLAEMYRLGYGTEIDMRLATKWYRRAAKYDNPFAEYKAAIIYLQPGEEQDIEKAMKYLRNANRSDLPQAAHLLGMLYLEGELIEADIEKAKSYLTKSYEADHPDTVALLSDLSAIQLDIQLKNKSELAQIHQANNSNDAKKVAAPKGEMEVIEVRAPELQEVFVYHIALLRKKTPDASRGTGTMLRGRGCGEMISCNSETDRDRIRDFLMSTW